MTIDESMMKEALKEARKGWGLTSPNPMVGAVVVRDGVIVGRGYHHGAGLPHAEPNALADAGENTFGATLYVTLEPCCTFGRTPPCTEAIKRAGIRRVVVGCTDCNPKHSGHGLAILREAGIDVISGICEKECLEINAAFFWWISTGCPYVRLKMAMTLDGKIATANGDSKWITGETARRYVQKLRRGSDAVMVGGETVRKDDPELVVREPKGWKRQPARIVWTSKPSLPDGCKLLNGNGGPVELAKPVTMDEWKAFLNGLGDRGMMSLLMEGGGELAGCALKAGIVNEIDFFIAPKILGGRGSRPVVGWENPLALKESLPLKEWRVRRIGDDLLVTASLDAQKD
ncbi:MAG: bifunctional diaminohydroxyphosphoribosylaminopyrimidine deaminase/5-amino-6-(5-phosphoribosylamino)uracil reductase RibD [Victivallales bacterium]|nr:bifunctional diaminohydroxyphosphoribosylaminopyrimidine deaminase/5-amino-6-(5-phosphoribosylamino)uracil reductase RibD [Victivallales bacterium]